MEFKLTIADSKQPGKVIGITRLARQSGYSPSHISRIFSRKTTPSLKCIQKLALILNMNIQDLFDKIEKGEIYAKK